MRVLGSVGVAMDAEHPLLAMDGGVVHLPVYGEIQHLSGGERGL
jgi:hypothetical protein